ncbi:hypothetical protein ElP_66670 [Tautonia plasticadhaerens]|uniref:Uncharacterized protein n=1 Tax=Tautonia plasticadhaerens TaxID=2527974 RepID=A0A518HCX3_9BACT|nr:hypothetical protein ElP_66670 [Tautonia plasticadhaerens]
MRPSSVPADARTVRRRSLATRSASPKGTRPTPTGQNRLPSESRRNEPNGPSLDRRNEPNSYSVTPVGKTRTDNPTPVQFGAPARRPRRPDSDPEPNGPPGSGHDQARRNEPDRAGPFDGAKPIQIPEVPYWIGTSGQFSGRTAAHRPPSGPDRGASSNPEDRSREGCGRRPRRAPGPSSRGDRGCDRRGVQRPSLSKSPGMARSTRCQASRAASLARSHSRWSSDREDSQSRRTSVSASSQERSWYRQRDSQP